MTALSDLRLPPEEAQPVGGLLGLAAAPARRMPVDLRIDRHVHRTAASAAVATAVSLTSSPSLFVLQAPPPLIAERQPQVVVEGHHTLTLKVNKFKCKRAADLSSMHTKD